MAKDSSEIKYVSRSSESLLDIASDVTTLLSNANETIGVSESLTGGTVMAALSSVPGSGQVFRGGVVSYQTPLKQLLLNVDADLIDKEGVIHADVAAQMAEGARKITSIDDREGEDGGMTTWGIGTTGVAGPKKQDEKPVGMVYIGLASPEGTQAFGPLHFPGHPQQVREGTVMEALSRLREAIQERNKRNGKGDMNKEDESEGGEANGVTDTKKENVKAGSKVKKDE